MNDREVTWLMKEVKIKAVEMVRGIRDEHYARTKDLSPAEKVAFFSEKARAFHAEIPEAPQSEHLEPEGAHHARRADAIDALVKLRHDIPKVPAARVARVRRQDRP